MTKGKLLVFEGLDSSGKETQAELLAQYLEDKDYEVEKFDFPNYDTSSGSLIKRYLGGMENLSQKTVNMIYSTNRYEQKSHIENALKIGIMVICDRYYYSNMAYGSFHGQTMEEIESMDSEMPKPNLVIWLDISVPESVKRSGKSADKNESNIEFLHKVKSNYAHMYHRNNNWVAVNGEEDKQEIHEQIVAIVENRLFK